MRVALDGCNPVASGKPEQSNGPGLMMMTSERNWFTASVSSTGAKDIAATRTSARQATNSAVTSAPVT